jgi:hypothetical protein
MGTEIYDDISYFTNRPGSIEQLSWESGQLRYGDQLAAIGYALGLESFEEFRNIFGFRDEGKENYPLLGAKMQMDMLWMARKRTPEHIIEIGGGRGEICLAFGYKEVLSILVEPSRSLGLLLYKTRKMFNMENEVGSNIMIANFPIGNFAFDDLSVIDTIILCETIEHISTEEFNYAFINGIKPLLQRTHGLLIITNWLTPFPLELDPPWHIQRVDDDLYDWISKDGETIYRNKNHLVVRY